MVITGETGTNLLTNPGFEGGDQDWGVVAGASITTAETHSGAKAVKAVLGAEGYASWNNLVTELGQARRGNRRRRDCRCGTRTHG